MSWTFEYFSCRFHINNFCRRQTQTSRFSHYEGSDETLLQLISDHFDQRIWLSEKGIIKLIVPPENFYSSVCELEDGDLLIGKFAQRENTKQAEVPRKTVWIANGKKLPAQSVELILYSSSLLAETGDNDLDAEMGNYELISINASPTKSPTPINPTTLLYNYFGMAGGTYSHLEDIDKDREKFVSELEEAFLFWHNKVLGG